MPLRTVLSSLNQAESVESTALKPDQNGRPYEAHSPSQGKSTVERKKRAPAKRPRKPKQKQQPVTDENQNLFLENNEQGKSPLTKRLQAIEPRSPHTPTKRKIFGNDSPDRSINDQTSPASTASKSSIKKRKVFGSKTVAGLKTSKSFDVPKYTSSELKNMSRRYEEAYNGMPLTPTKPHARDVLSSPSSIVVTPKRPSFPQRHHEPKSPLARRQKTLSPLSSPALEAVDLSKLIRQPTKPLLFQTCHKIWPHTSNASPTVQEVKPLTLMLRERLARAKSKILALQQEQAAEASANTNIRYTTPPISRTMHKAGESDTTVGNARNFFTRLEKIERRPLTTRAKERMRFVEATKSVLNTVADNDFKAIELVTSDDGRISLALTPLNRTLSMPSKRQKVRVLSPLIVDDLQSCPRTPSPKSSKKHLISLERNNSNKASTGSEAGYMCVNCHKFYKNKRGLTYHLDRCKFKHAPKSMKDLKRAVKTKRNTGDNDEQWRDAITDCICTSADDSGAMVQCDECEAWLHLDCIGLDEDNLEEEYFCPRCKNEYVSPTSSSHRSTGGKTVAGALEAQLKLQARLKKIKAKQSGNRSLLDRFVQEANNAYLETRMKQRMLSTSSVQDDEEDDSDYEQATLSLICTAPIYGQNEEDNTPATPAQTAVHVWEGFSLNVSPDAQHIWGTTDAFELSQPSDFLLDDEALSATLTQEASAAVPDTLPNESNTTDIIQPDYVHPATTPAEMVALSLKQQAPSSDIYMGSLIDDDDVGTSFASPMTDGDERHWNPMIKASPYLCTDITPFDLKIDDPGYFDLASLPLNTAATAPLDSWLATGDNEETGAEVVEQDFDGLINLDA